jgi:hypothetical protein
MAYETGSGRPVPHRPETRWSVAAALVTALVSLMLMFLPLGQNATSGSARAGPAPRSSVSVAPDVGTKTPVRTERSNLVQREGWGMARVLAIPVSVCALPLLFSGRVRRRAAEAVALLFALFVMAGLPSIGLFFLPSLILLAVAALRLRRADVTSTPHLAGRT